MSHKEYRTRDEWLNSPRENDRIELYYGIYLDSDNKVKTFVSGDEGDIPKDALITKRDIVTLADATISSSLMLNELEKFSSKIDSIKHSRRIRTYFYGVFRSSKGKVSTFICKTEAKIPTTAVLVKSGSMVGEIANQLADKLLKESRFPKEIKIKTGSFSVGDVVIYADLEGQHTAIVLQKGRQYSSLLFVTSNPYWNKRARKVTGDENILLGYPLRGRASYFAPVVRLNKYIVETGKSYPLYRVEDFIVEFKVNGC
jgi:hypothetical protein